MGGDVACAKLLETYIWCGVAEAPIEMNTELVLSVLDEHRDELRRLGVRRLGLFGSTVRNEATDASDLDFLVEFQSKSFDAYMDLKALLERVFDRHVDLVLPENLKPGLRALIDQDVRNYATGL
jgi:predicted nucleotidyltransferase